MTVARLLPMYSVPGMIDHFKEDHMSDLLASHRRRAALLGSNSAKKPTKNKRPSTTEQQAWKNVHVKHRDAKTRRGSDQGWVESSPGSGWNRAASTPTVSPATVEPTYKDSGNIGKSLNSAMMLRAQLNNLNANTEQQNSAAAVNAEKARQEKVTADNLEWLENSTTKQVCEPDHRD